MLLNARVAVVLAEQLRISVRQQVDAELLVGSPVGQVDHLLKNSV